jgi:nucleotide-binding universal stress UspA family protein
MDRVTVVVDGTPAGETAVDWVVEWLRVHEAAGESPPRVDAIAVFDPIPSESVLAGSEFRAVYEAVANAAAARISAASPATEVSAGLRTGQSRLELERASHDTDLLVAGTARRSGGSFYESRPIRIAATSACPTVVVPAGWSARGGASGGVVLGLEATEPQPLVVAFAAEFAESTGATLTAVHVWHVATLVAVVAFAHPGVWESVGGAHRTALDASVRLARQSHPGVEVLERLKEGNAARILAEEAAEADILVVGRRDHHARDDMFIGATTHDLLLSMPCPVVVVPE